MPCSRSCSGPSSWPARSTSSSASATAAADGVTVRLAAIELGQYGITVNSVAPEEIATRLSGNADVDPHTIDRPGLPLGRPGDAREIAAVVAFLAGPGASYVTGASWVVDGGMLQMGPTGGAALTDTRWLSG